jgi:hypothetical protein
VTRTNIRVFAKPLVLVPNPHQYRQFFNDWKMIIFICNADNQYIVHKQFSGYLSPGTAYQLHDKFRVAGMGGFHVDKDLNVQLLSDATIHGMREL